MWCEAQTRQEEPGYDCTDLGYLQQTPLARQNFSCTHLAQHELESILIVIIIRAWVTPGSGLPGKDE